MSLFSKSPKIKTVAVSLNTALNLPFSIPNDVFRMNDCEIRWITDDQYELNTKYYALNGASFVIDAHTTKQVIDGKSLPQYNLFRISKEEEKELNNIEKEYELWVKQYKLNYFKSLSSHIRQSMVDEAIIRKMSLQINKLDEEDFPNVKRMRELRTKQDPRYMPGMVSQSRRQCEYSYKYLPIISYFTLDELLNAHAEATLENEIVN